MMADQLYNPCEEVNYLNPFQSRFKAGYVTEIALVFLVDDLCQDLYKYTFFCVVLLDF